MLRIIVGIPFLLVRWLPALWLGRILWPRRKNSGTRRVTFKKADFERFAKKMEGWSTSSLSPEERALLVAALNKGSQGIRKAGGGTVQTTTSIKMAEDFNLGQFIIELILALEGVSAEVDEDGPTWVEEIDTGKT